jgi:chromosomal replication initiation ATPase DnaA
MRIQIQKTASDVVITAFEGTEKEYEDLIKLIVKPEPVIEQNNKVPFNIPVEKLLTIFYDYFQLTKEDITKKSRLTGICDRKRILCYFVKNHCEMSCKQFESYVKGNFDHSNILHHARKAGELIQSDEAFRQLFNGFKNHLIEKV